MKDGDGRYRAEGRLPGSEPLASASAERYAEDLSQEALADRRGVHWTFLGQVERGQHNLSLHNLLKIDDGLLIEPGRLMRGCRLLAVAQNYVAESSRSRSSGLGNHA